MAYFLQTEVLLQQFNAFLLFNDDDIFLLDGVQVIVNEAFFGGQPSKKIAHWGQRKAIYFCWLFNDFHRLIFYQNAPNVSLE